jgi:hypothetical protein
MFVAPPDFLGTGLPMGLMLFGVALLAMGAGFVAIQRIVDIEV